MTKKSNHDVSFFSKKNASFFSLLLYLTCGLLLSQSFFFVCLYKWRFPNSGLHLFFHVLHLSNVLQHFFLGIVFSVFLLYHLKTLIVFTVLKSPDLGTNEGRNLKIKNNDSGYHSGVMCRCGQCLPSLELLHWVVIKITWSFERGEHYPNK